MAKKQLTVLVVEDEQDYREILVGALTSRKFTALQESNGEDGVKTALEKHPDLILFDLMMPKMDGMTAFKKIREDAWGKDVPVIILTNLSANTENLVADIVTTKPFHYLVKSNARIYDVVDKIEQILKSK